MSVTIQFSAPAAGPNRELTADETNILVFSEANPRTTITVKGAISPAASVTHAGIVAESSYLIIGRMMGREIRVSRSVSNPPQLLDFIGALSNLSLDASGNFQASVLLNEGENIISVVATEADGTKTLAQLRVTMVVGMSGFPSHMVATDDLKQAQNDWRIPSDGQPNIPEDGTI